jgi:hypothetical protein
MSRQTAELINAFRKLAHTETVIIPGIVQAVDEEKGTLIVQTAEGLKIEDVRLRSVIGDNDGVMVFPQKGSSVLMARINNSNNFVVISIEKVDKVKYFLSGKYLEMDKDGLQVSAGDDTLKKCIDDLLDEIITIYAPMNKAAFTDIKQRLAKILK